MERDDFDFDLNHEYMKDAIKYISENEESIYYACGIITSVLMLSTFGILF